MKCTRTLPRLSPFTVASLLTVALALPCQPVLCAQPYTFADIPWGTPAKEVQSLLSSKGYAFQRVDQEGDYLFKGTVQGTAAVVWALMSEGKLAKISVTLETRDQDARRIFENMKGILIGKYGKPKQAFHFFERPYYEGDGYEQSAIKLGKGHFSAFWGEDSALMIQLTDRLTVAVGYQAPWYAEEAERRRRRSTKDF